MDKANFATVTAKLYSYFRYSKMPDKEQIDLWYEDVKFIPAIAVDWIFDNMRRADDGLPRNFPKAFIANWYAYRKAHPEKITSGLEFCDDCLGHGIHLFRIQGEVPYTYIARCGHCRNWVKEFGSLSETGGTGVGKYFGPYITPVLTKTRRQIIEAGYEYLPLEDPKAIKKAGKIPTVQLNEIPEPPRVYTGPRN